MNKPPSSSSSGKIRFLSRLSRNYSGALTPVALSVLSAWLIVTGLKGLIGFTVNQQTALADLLGIIIVVALARLVKTRHDVE